MPPAAKAHDAGAAVPSVSEANANAVREKFVTMPLGPKKSTNAKPRFPPTAQTLPATRLARATPRGRTGPHSTRLSDCQRHHQPLSALRGLGRSGQPALCTRAARRRCGLQGYFGLRRQSGRSGRLRTHRRPRSRCSRLPLRGRRIVIRPRALLGIPARPVDVRPGNLHPAFGRHRSRRKGPAPRGSGF